MEINYDKWKNRWSSNEIIVLILLSLGMQIGLIVLAPLRKRSKNPVLKLTLWLLYLTADSVAILALGNISNQDEPETSAVDSGTLPGKLTVLWAPFLLVHLGGPDSITSYSVEDNELWWHHLLGLVVQVVVTIYLFWQSPPKGLMWIPTMLVFVPGLIKFAERTHALRLGSKDNLNDKIISDLTIGKEDQGEVLTESMRNGHGDSQGETNGNEIGTSTSEQHAVPAVETTVKNEEEVGSTNCLQIEPVDLNHFFGEDGKIYGYNGLQINVWLSMVSFHAYVDVSFESKCQGGKGVTDLKDPLKSIFGESLLEKEEFLQTFSRDRDYVRNTFADGEAAQLDSSYG